MSPRITPDPIEQSLGILFGEEVLRRAVDVPLAHLSAFLSPAMAPRRVDDLGSVQDARKMSTDGQPFDGLRTSDGGRMPQQRVTSRGGENPATQFQPTLRRIASIGTHSVLSQEPGDEADRDRGAAREVGRREGSHLRLPSDRAENKSDGPTVIAAEPFTHPLAPAETLRADLRGSV